MKIIGMNGKEMVLLEMNRTEYARLIGLSYESQLKDEDLDGRHRDLLSRINQISSLETLPEQVADLERTIERLGSVAKSARALVDSTKFTPIRAAKK